MPERPIAIVVALKREVAPLLRGLRSKRISELNVFEMDKAVVAIGGVGRQAASRAAEMLVAGYSPRLMVSAGIAGAITAARRTARAFPSA